MTRSRSALLPILRSETQARVLAATLLAPGAEPSLTDLASSTGSDLAGVQREVDRLVLAGVLADRRVGRTRLVRAGDSALIPALRELLLIAYGPKPLLEEALGRLPGVRKAFVYGSWAARHAGRPGPEPNDVDVLVVGDPDKYDLHDAVGEVSRRIAREVNVVVRSEEAWSQASGTFLQTVMERPLVELRLGES